jgi:microcin C transport system substrate-binding protein
MTIFIDKKNFIKLICTFFVLFVLVASSSTKDCVENYTCSTSITMFSKQSLEFNNQKLPYVNENAPKKGRITYAAIGTFDSLNPFILKGVSASGIGSIYDTLLTGAAEDIFTRHGFLVDKIMYANDKKSIIFDLKEGAKWHDGKPIVADDVVFTFNTLIEKGKPFYSAYYSDIESVEKLGEKRVRFNFKNADNRELPFIIGDLAILPKHFYEGKDFNDSFIDDFPLGSGAYKVKEVDAGRSVTYERVDNYWAKDLPFAVGLNNFDEIKYDYYRDATVAVEAFKSGEYDIRQENIARIWANSYNIPKVESGEIIKEEIPHQLPTGMQSFSFNLRREKFQDIKVREALGLAFDFEWTNKTLFYNSYDRTRSYFSNTIYEAKGTPSEQELEILNKYKDKIPASVFEEEYQPPVTDGSGNNRQNLIKAKKLLEEAGWVVKNGKLQNDKGEVFQIEFLINTNAFERVIEPYIKNLNRLGVQSTMRLVDPTQYIKRNEDFDFDVIVRSFGSGMIPGNELYNYWHSSRADINGSGNLSGVKNPVVDELVDKVIKSQTQDDLINNTKALDRVLQHNLYVVPHWNLQKFRLIYWNKFDKPEVTPKFGVGIDSWWVK